MAAYTPIKITGPSAGLVQQREEFILPNDAYPSLQNAYVWRERLKRKRGCQLLGRLQRNLTALSEPNPDGSATYQNDLLASFRASQPNAQVVPGTMQFYLDFGLGNQTLYEDDGAGNVTVTSGPFTISSGSINYTTGVLTLNFTSVPGAGVPAQVNLSYNPFLPVMGIRTQELQNSSVERTVFFDQVYAYVFDSVAGAFKEYIPGTTWNAHGAGVDGVDFFFSTNYWVSQTTIPGTATPLFGTTNLKLFWETNNTGQFGGAADPVRITDGATWVDFFPSIWSQIDATNFLTNWLCMLPYRGRMVTFNTWEGATAAASINYRQRIRWSTIGNPFIPYSAGPPARGSWRDDVRGQGGFLDIPTAEDIVSVGFVRDNLVIYCERSTWQLRYTGRSIAPFQIERVNSELGTESTFSAIQFDTSLLGIGDKGIVECDSYKSDRIDIKIPDFVFQINTKNNGLVRIQGIRDFINRLAFWTVPIAAKYEGNVPSTSWIFPNQRLVYNYENDSWALFDDSYTALGTYQEQTSRTWKNTKLPWVKCNFPWISQPQGVPVIVAGNQQGFIERFTETTTNDVSLSITNIVSDTPSATIVTSPNHNMSNGFVIEISGIPTGTPFDTLNGQVFGILLGDGSGSDTPNKFRLYKYNATSMQFSDPQVDAPGTFTGYGLISIRDNFSIQSKKFNFLDEGRSIQLGFLDILMEATEDTNPGAISLYVYLDYNTIEASNILPMNSINNTSPPTPDTFFNSVIPTTPSTLNQVGGTKFWQRVFCSTGASFLTLEYTFSNAQMAGVEQQQDVQIDAQVLWIRRGGRMTQI